MASRVWLYMELHQRISRAYTEHVNKGWYPDVTIHSSFSGNYKRAAVLCCIREDESGELHVLLTIRSEKVSTHVG